MIVLLSCLPWISFSSLVGSCDSAICQLFCTDSLSCDQETLLTIHCVLSIWPRTSMSLCLQMSPVHCPAVLWGRAEDVSRIQHLRFIPLHVAARSPHGWSDTGLLFLPAKTSSGHKYVISLYSLAHILPMCNNTFNVNMFMWLFIGSSVVHLKMDKLCSMWQKCVWPPCHPQRRPLSTT